ncbi:MAG: PEP/pyruvate-binding domain-containing protein, partial [Gammaproteobacteria bacterium]|nr:PEP/pyruvate-binding domain-containing protein [Gammaproteobacteria bacterium]
MPGFISNELIRPLRELDMDDVATVGGKNASLGEMLGKLADAGVSVPDGYATTAQAFQEFLDHNGLREKIRDQLENLDIDDVDQLAATGRKIRQWIIDAPLHEPLRDSVIQ